MLEKLVWYDRVLLFSKESEEKIDLCLLSPGDFMEGLKEMRENVPAFVFTANYSEGSFKYHNCLFVKSDIVHDGHPLIYKQLKNE